jgi:multisubunit Na+/H+ antiporter MnhG subunit
MKEKIVKTATTWLSGFEQGGKKAASNSPRVALAVCIVAGAVALIGIGNILSSSDEMLVFWIVATLRLFLRVVIVIALGFLARAAYRIGLHAWEKKEESPYKQKSPSKS